MDAWMELPWRKRFHLSTLLDKDTSIKHEYEIGGQKGKE